MEWQCYLDGDEGAGPLEDLLELLLRLVGAQRVPRLGHHVLADGADVVVVLFKIKYIGGYIKLVS